MADVQWLGRRWVNATRPMWSIVFPMDVFLNALRARVLRRKIPPHQLNHIKLARLSVIGCWREDNGGKKSKCEKKKTSTQDSDEYGVKWNIVMSSLSETWSWFGADNDGELGKIKKTLSLLFFTTHLPGLFGVYAWWQVSPYLCESTPEPKTLLVVRRLWFSSSQRGLSPSAVDRNSNGSSFQVWNHLVHFVLEFVSVCQTDKHQRVHVGRWEY